MLKAAHNRILIINKLFNKDEEQIIDIVKISVRICLLNIYGQILECQRFITVSKIFVSRSFFLIVNFKKERKMRDAIA